MTEQQPKPSWRVRRRIIFATLFYCAGMGIGTVFMEVELAKIVWPSISWLAGGIIASYIFGASAEDVFISRGR